MEQILQGLHDLEGVLGTFLFNNDGQVICHRAQASYDQPLLEQLSSAMAEAIQSVQLEDETWDNITTTYLNGQLMIRNLTEVKLAIIADQSLNQSFANMAIRVAVKNLQQAIAQGALTAQGGASAAQQSTLSWPDDGKSSVPVADEQAADFLSLCSSNLAQSVGPMAKIFIKEAVYNLMVQDPFAMEHAVMLVSALMKHIDSLDDQATFQRAIGVMV